MIINNKYGYKVCYKEQGKIVLKRYLVTNTFNSALYNLKYYLTYPQFDRKSKKLIYNPRWYIIPVRTLLEYKILWKGCPF